MNPEREEEWPREFYAGRSYDHDKHRRILRARGTPRASPAAASHIVRAQAASARSSNADWGRSYRSHGAPGAPQRSSTGGSSS
jgi:hypothetical protein